MITQIDIKILDFIQQILKSDFFDVLFTQITRLGDNGILFIALAIGLMLCKKTRKKGFALALSLLISFIACNIIIKNTVQRIRPFDIKEVELIISKPHDFSFPSGHSWHSFATATVLGAYYKKHRIWLYIVAFLIAFSRLYLYVHYPTDVIAGCVFGTLTGFFAVKIIKNICFITKRCNK